MDDTTMQTDSTPQHHDQDPVQHRPRSSGSGSRSGCGIMAAIVGVIVILTVWPMFDAWSAVRRFEKTASDAGYTIVSEGGVALVSDTPAETPTYYRAIDSVQILNGANTDIAISSGEATLDGTFTGNVAFLGRDLTLLPGGVILGDRHGLAPAGRGQALRLDQP